jgi:hypothetical protein
MPQLANVSSGSRRPKQVSEQHVTEGSPATTATYSGHTPLSVRCESLGPVGLANTLDPVGERVGPSAVFVGQFVDGNTVCTSRNRRHQPRALAGISSMSSARSPGADLILATDILTTVERDT